jgi:aromatic amino acid aminotransferase I
MAPPSAIEVSAETDTSGVMIPNPLTAPITSNDIYGRRKKMNKSQWGIAAASDTANFRQKTYENKPKAKRWARKSHIALIRKWNRILTILIQTS